MLKKSEYDLCVVGGGAAGLVVAAGAAGLGARVLLVEKNKLGGDCLHTGCVPSKALLHAACVAHNINTASHIGFDAQLRSAGLGNALAYVQSVVAAIAPQDSPERFRKLGVEVLFGSGAFVKNNVFRINDRNIRARKYVIATGSRPYIPEISGLERVPFFTNETLFTTRENIKSIIIVGSGAIGIELAQALSRLGVKVILLSHSANILCREDADLSSVLADQLMREGITIEGGRSVKNVVKLSDDIVVEHTDQSGKTHKSIGSHLLLATGRMPNIEDLALENAGVETYLRGIAVNRKLQTTNKYIYACGDVVGNHMFSHMAEHHAHVVLRNALFHIPAKVENNIIPWCTFTDPELARVGVSETEAKERNLEHRVYQFSFKDIDRAVIENKGTGLIKVIVDKKGRIIGAGIVGPNAGELIHEYILAMKQKMKLDKLSSMIHVYPTLSQINRRVADDYIKSKLTPRIKRLLTKLFGLRGN
ncbi:MAG: FAD-dependent oxidoreductase [Gammaproteobacteria bacterium]|nr:FAD-dependent oxidoreductase [Gammaproteobacteria bacterium]